MELSVERLKAALAAKEEELAETRHHLQRTQEQQNCGNSSASGRAGGSRKDAAAAAEVGAEDASASEQHALEVAGLRKELHDVQVRVQISSWPRDGDVVLRCGRAQGGAH